MTGAEYAEILTGTALLITSIGNFIISMRNNSRLNIVSDKVDEVHTATNGLTAKLVATTARASQEQGNREGRAELKDEQSHT